jgi:glycosyltransferase involved in cell wall biosynthesis
MTPTVTVVCPTFDRPQHLDGVIRCFAEQTYRGDMELIILDDSGTQWDSPALLDRPGRKVHYVHMPVARMTTGAKLNLMMELAAGEVIVRFDDDDYYAPEYVESMIELAADADIFTLSGWFAYCPAQQVFCYWQTDVRAATHFVVSPWEPVHTVSGDIWDDDAIGNYVKGYGFSTLWRRSLFPRFRFPDSSFGEDSEFYQAVESAGFRGGHAADHEGLALHVIHDRNTSRMFPQYLIPTFLLPRFFPGYVVSGGP